MAAIDASPEPLPTDGRRLRRERNRDAAVEALLALYRAGRLDPSAAEVAEHAGLSPRSVFRYFDDVDDLVRTAIERQTQHLLPVIDRAVDPDMPLGERITQFVDQRIAVFDRIGGSGRVARLRAPFHPEIAAGLTKLRRHLRRQVSDAFAPELEARGEPARRPTLAALDVLFSYESWDLMTGDQGLTRNECRAALCTAVAALLAHPESPATEILPAGTTDRTAP